MALSAAQAGLIETGEGAGEEVLLGSAGGLMTRTRLAGVPVLSRATKGVRLMRLADGDAVQSATPLRAVEAEA